jgi:hypothetical protein
MDDETVTPADGAPSVDDGRGSVGGRATCMIGDAPRSLKHEEGCQKQQRAFQRP